MEKGDFVTYVVNSEGDEFSARLGKVREVRDSGNVDLVLEDKDNNRGRKGIRLDVIFVKPSDQRPANGVFCRAPKDDELPSTMSTTTVQTATQETTDPDGNDPDMERDISHIPNNNG